eukprot:CAMPEP_0119546132 /NCGR_PEP_ID=MMETSP1352-20130426/677_1 /TAXON_ID=265584 /ORGANISM="Stauroneis constricta, Strain CCMP1120" /LENGTH=168 /DNA_ID=CAMNT_0007590797 /DNA_START=77 /DNA_END=583 /DNA_ORIENTATION=-
MTNAIYEAVLVSAPDFSGENSNPMKQGHSCCGGCCDMRRATIIVNIIRLCLGIIGLSSMGAMSSMSFDDDSMGHMNHVDVNWFTITVGVLNVLCSAAAIYGAVIYNSYLVGVNVVFLALTMFNMGIVSVVANGFFIYPHAFLIHYIEKGIMSEDNYENERQSCCCVPV